MNYEDDVMFGGVPRKLSPEEKQKIERQYKQREQANNNHNYMQNLANIAYGIKRYNVDTPVAICVKYAQDILNQSQELADKKYPILKSVEDE